MLLGHTTVACFLAHFPRRLIYCSETAIAYPHLRSRHFSLLVISLLAMTLTESFSCFMVLRTGHRNVKLLKLVSTVPTWSNWDYLRRDQPSHRSITPPGVCSHHYDRLFRYFSVIPRSSTNSDCLVMSCELSGWCLLVCHVRLTRCEYTRYYLSICSATSARQFLIHCYGNLVTACRLVEEIQSSFV